MAKKLILIAVILSISFLASAQDFNEKDTFLAAKQAYDSGSYGVSMDLLNKFIIEFPASKAIPEAKLYLGQCLFQKEKFIEAREVLTKLDKDYVPYGIEDKLLFWLGQVYLKVKDFDQASEYYNKMISSYPESSLLYSAKMQLGWIYTQQERYEEAQAVFGILTESDDSLIQEEALFKKAELEFQTKKYAASLDSLAEFVKIFVESEQLPNAYYYMAESSFYLNDFDKALDYYAQALERSDNDLIKAECHQGQGWCYLNQNKFAPAEEAFSKVDDFISDGFNKESLFLGKATLYFKLNKLSGALSYYDMLIQDYPQSAMVIQAWLGRAECLSSLSRFSEAIEAYREVVRLGSRKADPEAQELVSRSHYNLGTIFWESDDFDSAVGEFEQVLSLSRDQEVKLSVLYQMGETYQSSQEFDKAIEIYEKISQDYPQSSYNDYVLYQKGLAQLRSKQTDQAIATFMDFNKQFVDSEFLDDSFYYLCYAYFSKNEFEMAIQQFSKFLEIFPDSIYKAQASYFLALSFYNKGVLNEALYNFERALKNSKQDKELAQKADYEIAHTLFELGDKEAAAKRYTGFVNSYPRSELTPNVIFWLGQYYRSQLKYDPSRRYFEMLVRMFPDHELAQEAKYQIGLISLEQGNQEEAVEMFQRLLDVSDQSELKARTMLATADLLLRQGDDGKAVDIYNELTQLASSNNIDSANNKEALSSQTKSYIKLAYIRLGDINKQNNGFSQAIGHYEQALQFSSDASDAQIQFDIAECFELDNNLDAALDKYSSIQQKAEQDKAWIVKGLLRSSQIYEDRREWEQAINTYEKIVSYDLPEAKYAQEKIEEIRKRK